jgi:hypothetical protein
MGKGHGANLALVDIKSLGLRSGEAAESGKLNEHKAGYYKDEIGFPRLVPKE